MEVAPILRQHCSLALAEIVERAMNPNPDLRYQNTEEMLSDIRHLRDNDPRVRRWKRTRTIACIVLSFLFLVGGLSTFAGLRQAERDQRTEAEFHRVEAEVHRTEAETQRTEAEAQRTEAEAQQTIAKTQTREARIQEMHVQAANSAEALRSGDRYGAIAFALDATPDENDIWMGIQHIPEAKKALADALGVYDMSDGFMPHRTIILPSETMGLAIAPDGSSFAAMSFGRLSVFAPESGELLAELPAIESGLADARYTGINTIAFASSDGLALYDLARMSVIWNGTEATTIAVSADCSIIACVNRDDTVADVYSIDGIVQSEIDFGSRQMWTASNDRFGNPGGRVFELNEDGSLLAVSFSNGSLEIFNTKDGSGYIEIFDASEYVYFEGGFHGKYFAFSAANDEGSVFSVIDTQRYIQTISTTLPDRIGVYADKDGIYMSLNEINVSIDPETAVQMPIDHDPRECIAGGFRIEGNLSSPVVRIEKFLSHSDKEILVYDRSYAHNEARLNLRGDRLMLFSFNHFRLYDIDGSLATETTIPNPGQVYDQQYRRIDGASYLEVFYYDGSVHKYSGDDGVLIGSKSIPPPDPSMYEEFETEYLQITAPLHGFPSAYDISTGSLIRELERDAYLTYVTQVEDFVVTEYISATGQRYGLLLDGRTCETLACIPYLCDLVGDRLIIDIQSSGSIRETRIYETGELIEMARAVLSAT